MGSPVKNRKGEVFPNVWEAGKAAREIGEIGRIRLAFCWLWHFWPLLFLIFMVIGILAQ